MGNIQKRRVEGLLAVQADKLKNSYCAWNATQEQYVREHYGKTPTRQIAAHLGRSIPAVQLRAEAMGVSGSREFTEEEIRAVEELYGTHTAKQISQKLYGTEEKWMRISKLASRKGLTKVKPWSESVRNRVHALHAEGCTDREIANRMADIFPPNDAGLKQVEHIRKNVFGLAVNRDTRNRGQLCRDAKRRFAAKYGLPDDLCPGQVRIILALLNGPKTLRELRQSIGVSSSHRLTLRRTKGSYQSDLVDRGLVARVLTRQQGRGCGPSVYMLTVACLDMLASQAETKGIE